MGMTHALAAHAMRWLLRSLLVAFAVIVAYTVPFFDTMMTLIGALCVAQTVFVMPALFHLKLAWSRITTTSKLLDILTIALGVFGGVVGGAQAVIEIADKLS